jgi:hypothetical protein
MQATKVGSTRVGLAEYVFGIGLIAVGGLAIWAVSSGFVIAIVPGVSYLVAGSAAYGIYRAESARRAWAAMSFRVVDARGSCPLGRGIGDLVTIGTEGNVTPELCEHGQAVLRMASEEGPESVGSSWCCPVYDHLLVFRREPAAA